ncbi:MAG: hypothetical protein JNM21_02605 [Taibaiella sp.]|nr:hypothetical protein [Taibaiella sp.]
MKNRLLLFIATSLSLSTLSQAQTNGNQVIDPRIAEVYGGSLDQLLNSDPDRLKILNELLNNRIKVIELDAATAQQKFPALNSQPIFNKYVHDLTVGPYNAATFNPLKYDLKFFEYGDSGYWINGTNKVLFITGFKNYTAN